MRKQLLAGAAAIAITAASGGAGLAADRPIITKAPPPLMDWSGLYAGAHVGWGRAKFRGTWIDTSAGALFPWSTSPSGPLAGVHIGQNFQVNTFLYGWEVDVSGLSGWDETLVGINPNFILGGVTTKVSLLASLRGRLGVILNPQTLVYVTGGLGYTRAKATAFTPSSSASLNSYGPVVGAGAEWKQNQQWSWRAEGLWYGFDESATIPVVVPLQTATVKLKDAWVFRVGATYHFSDARLKRDVALLARRDDGVGIYRYRYLWSDQVYVGVMAQEVARLYPDAVVCGSDGYLRVDYAPLGLRLMTWDEWQGRARTELSLAA